MMAHPVDLSGLTPVGLQRFGQVLAYAVRLAEHDPAAARVDILPKGSGDDIGFRVRLVKPLKPTTKKETT